ncbi:MAG: SIS domain-containing protein [Patescibacteria group bacterium]
MNLDNLTAVKKLDQKNVAGSIANLPQQLLASWTAAKKIKIPAAFAQADNIVFCGLGGSNLASELLRRVFGAQIKVPLILARGYNLPAFAGPGTLVIIDSYSGNTEETLACLSQARKMKTKIICISAGGKIAALAKKNRLVHFKIDPALNPSGQPRYDIGSQLGTALAIFDKLKLIGISEKELIGIARGLAELNAKVSLISKSKNNPAKKLAAGLAGKNIYIIGAEHLSANAHILANQINESAKHLASPYRIPEFNHHFLEALTFPKKVTRQTAFIFLVSADYSPRIMKRFIITKRILDQKKIKNYLIRSTVPGALRQALEVLAVGSWASLYLALINGVNPAAIPWVDYFKSSLD